jgi:hypothetical protein
VTAKCYNSQNQKTKLNFDYTIKFVSINSLKLDPTWIYLDKVTSGPHSGWRMIQRRDECGKTIYFVVTRMKYSF